MIFVFALLISISFFISIIGFVMDNDLSVIGLFMAIIFLLLLIIIGCIGGISELL